VKKGFITHMTARFWRGQETKGKSKKKKGAREKRVSFSLIGGGVSLFQGGPGKEKRIRKKREVAL